MSIIHGNAPSLLAQTTAYIKDGLVFYVDAGNKRSYNSGSNIIYDLSGNNHTGSLINSPTFDNNNGGSITFDAVDDYIEMSSSLSSVIVTDTPGFTITGWFNASVNDGNWRTVISKQLGNNRQYFIGLNGGYGATGGAFTFFSNQGGGGGISTTAAIQTNTWHYFAVTHYGIDGNNANTLYIRTLDQELNIGSPFNANSTNGAIDSDNGTAPVRIGKYTDSNPFLFSGKVANITYYNRKLSQSEILQNYNATKGRYGLSSTTISTVPKVPTNGLVLSLDAANAKSYVSGSNTINDLTINRYTGSLVNNPTFSSNNKGSIVFNGNNSHINLGNILDFSNGNFTVQFWHYKTDGDNQYILSKYNSSGNGLRILYTSGGNIKITAGSIFDTDLLLDLTVTNVWTHLTVVVSANDPENPSSSKNVLIYFNGQYWLGGLLGGTSGVSTDLIIGADRTLSNGFGGNISNLNIYNRMLSAQEISDSYNTTKYRYNL